MIKEVWNEFQKLLAFVFIMAALIVPPVVAYKVGRHNERRMWAEKIVPEIRRVERLNALAPRNEE